MSFVQRLLNTLDAGIWKFVRIVHSSNHDYPYHDFLLVDNEEGEGILSGSYIVGSNNITAHGDQHKHFTSKRTNVWADTDSVGLKFNHSSNVEVQLPMRLFAADGDVIVHEKEFHTSISVIFYAVPEGKKLWVYFEGVLPQEARDAE